MRAAAIASLAVVLGLGTGARPEVEIREDRPVASRPSSGSVTGRITPAEKVAGVHAVSRVTGKRYAPDRFDRKTGEFRFAGLPGDATYDVTIVTADKARIEGIDLSWHEARLLRLAEIRRKQLKLPAPPKHEFSADDAAELIRYVADLKDFADVRRVLYLRGDGPRATMLVEVMRVRDFYAKKSDQLIWRTELWYFKYAYGGWERVANVERVLERHRIPAAKWRKITLVYYPELSVYVDENGRAKPLKFEIPAKLDSARGRLAGTEPVQKTKPIVLGLPTRPRPR